MVQYYAPYVFEAAWMWKGVSYEPVFNRQKVPMQESHVLGSEEDGRSFHETSLLSFSAFRRHQKWSKIFPKTYKKSKNPKLLKCS